MSSGGGPETIIPELRSSSLSDEDAWEKVQPLLTERIEGYPEILYPSYEQIAKDIFRGRRRAALTRVDGESLEINRGVSSMFRNLDEVAQEVLLPVFAEITTIFDIKSFTNSGGRRWNGRV
jgi:hypothetical protein